MKKWIDIFLNFIIGITILVLLWFFTQVFLVTSFHIPSDSMEPNLTEGDAILVWKPTLGARLFNLQATMQLKQVEIHRTPRFRKVRRNDVLVFNFPHPNGWDKIEMHILKYYIKRCIDLPGDTLSIRNGIFQINGVEKQLGNLYSQHKIGQTQPGEFPDGIYKSFPFDSIINWNIQDFGPLYIPKAGDKLTIDRTNYILYRKLIEWEQKGKLEYRDSLVLLNEKSLESYWQQPTSLLRICPVGMATKVLCSTLYAPSWFKEPRTISFLKQRLRNGGEPSFIHLPENRTYRRLQPVI